MQSDSSGVVKGVACYTPSFGSGLTKLEALRAISIGLR